MKRQLPWRRLDSVWRSMTFGRAKCLDLELLLMPSTNEKARRAGARRASHATEAQCKVVGRFSITFALSTSSAASMRASFGWSAGGLIIEDQTHEWYRLANCRCPGFRNPNKGGRAGRKTFSSVIRKSRMMIVGTITKSRPSSAPENSNKNRLPSTIGRASILSRSKRVRRRGSQQN